MMTNGARVSLALAILIGAGAPAFAETPTARKSATQTAGTAAQGKPASSFVPADFTVPTLIEAEGFKLSPLGPDKAKMDFDAYMSSIEHLQKTFSRSTAWPHAGISDAEAMKDMKNEQAQFAGRKSFAYAVLTPDGERELGSVYVSPSPVAGYDAVVRMWVTKAQYDAGFDARLYKWVADWIRKDWPFARVAYPGRAIDWNIWDAKVAAEKAGKAGA